MKLREEESGKAFGEGTFNLGLVGRIRILLGGKRGIPGRENRMGKGGKRERDICAREGALS